jgi:cytochrome b pre-mRNA-processing protein 3
MSIRAFLAPFTDPWSARAARRRTAAEVYDAILRQARQPAPFLRHQVPDSFDGRFDALCVHVFLVVRRLAREGKPGAELARDIYDAMFADMDRTLREMGVGDLGVGRRVQQMAEAVMGRAKAYGDAMDAPDPNALENALRRNLFGTVEEPAAGSISAVAAYMRSCEIGLGAQNIADLVAKGPDFAEWERG